MFVNLTGDFNLYIVVNSVRFALMYNRPTYYW